MQQIKDFVVGKPVNGNYLIRSIEFKMTRGGGSFDIELGDATGTIEAKKWQTTEEQMAVYPAGSLVNINGLVTEWNNQPQLTINMMNVVEDADLSAYVKMPKERVQDLMEILYQYIDKINYEDIRTVVRTVINENRDQLFIIPAAAKNHHAYYGGLLYHKVQMLRMAEFICTLRPFLKPGLVYAGIILHDIGKVHEMQSTPWTTATYTTRGRLVGHVCQAVFMMHKAAFKKGISIDNDLFLQLEHILLSHHGLKEHGSPVEPQTPEAYAVNHIDGLDAGLQAMEDAINQTPLDKNETERLGMINRRTVSIFRET
ncbi:3'-5' exoribonuclease YhaM [compost metagenome]